MRNLAGVHEVVHRFAARRSVKFSSAQACRGRHGSPCVLRILTRTLALMTEQIDWGSIEAAQDNPLHRLMGIVIEHREQSYAKVHIELSDNVRGALPVSLHGGIMASLADVTSAFALWGSYAPNEEIPVTTDMHIRYYRQPRSSPVTAEARIRPQGKTAT